MPVKATPSTKENTMYLLVGFNA